MSHRITLEQIKIAEPCHASWETMTGDAQKRFCESCAKHVHDLSTMSRAEAEALVNSGVSVCVRMHRGTDDAVRTRDSMPLSRDTVLNTGDSIRTTNPAGPLQHHSQARSAEQASSAGRDRPLQRWFRIAAGFAAMLGVGSLFQLGCEKPRTVTGSPQPTPPEEMQMLGRIAAPKMGLIALPEPTVCEPPTDGPVIMGDIAPTTLPTTRPANDATTDDPSVELGAVAVPEQPKQSTTQPTAPTDAPIRMGKVAAPTTHPSTAPTTRPTTAPTSPNDERQPVLANVALRRRRRISVADRLKQPSVSSRVSVFPESVNDHGHALLRGRGWLVES